jgi:hypothetical protein
MAAGLGAESLAARFKAGDGLEGYLGRWLLLEAAGGDVEAEDNLATSRQIPLIRIVVGEKLNMEDIGTSWYQQTQDREAGDRGEHGAGAGGTDHHANRWFYRVKVASLVTTKPLDVPMAAQYGGAYTRGGLKSSEPMAMDGSVYADKAVSWAAKYAGGSTVVYPAGLKWKPRFLWKGYSISKMTEKKGTAMRALGWDLGKSVNKVGGGHFEEPILGGGHGAATRTPPPRRPERPARSIVFCPQRRSAVLGPGSASSRRRRLGCCRTSPRAAARPS